MRDDPVFHPEFGPGTLRDVLGSIAVVDFYGESIEVNTSDLTILNSSNAPAVQPTSRHLGAKFRQAFEAINLGVVPPYPDELISLTINGEELAAQTARWLKRAKQSGLCKVVFGDYGSGKSHYLRLVEASAIKEGWAVSYIEFDPKEADPAKPHLVYRALMANLHFPSREDGTRSVGFLDLVRELRPRERWEIVSSGRYFKRSPWFRATLGMLRHYSHDGANLNYVNACQWLAGSPVHQQLIRTMCRETACREVPPTMPRSRECADIYVFHLVVLNEICRALGYKGLLIILDEAEHVRGFNVRRKERANNLFDLLSRAAHPPIKGEGPSLNEHNHELPRYWKEGPHFGLIVGLTEGDTFSDPSLELREACVFLHDNSDKVILTRPTKSQYHEWCAGMLERFHQYDPFSTQALSGNDTRDAIAAILAEEYTKTREMNLRLWVKLAALVPAMILSGGVSDPDQVCSTLKRSVREAAGRLLPWEIRGDEE